eukprot:5065049-Amphidinium_carterae.1
MPHREKSFGPAPTPRVASASQGPRVSIGAGEARPKAPSSELTGVHPELARVPSELSGVSPDLTGARPELTG